MASDYQAAGIRVGHGIHVLRSITIDLRQGFENDPNERRFISASVDDLEVAASALLGIIAAIHKAGTSHGVDLRWQVAQAVQSAKFGERDDDEREEEQDI